MPCIFLKNVPSNFLSNNPSYSRWSKEAFQAQRLYAKVAEAAGCDVTDVDVHLSSENFKLLTSAGIILDCPNIHGFVLWYGSEKRNKEVKQRIADALQYYLNQFGIGKGFDLTFMDMPAGSFFIEKDGLSVMVEGGEILPPFSVITETAGEVTGFGQE